MNEETTIDISKLNLVDYLKENADKLSLFQLQELEKVIEEKLKVLDMGEENNDN